MGIIWTLITVISTLDENVMLFSSASFVF